MSSFVNTKTRRISTLCCHWTESQEVAQNVISSFALEISTSRSVKKNVRKWRNFHEIFHKKPGIYTPFAAKFHWKFIEYANEVLTCLNCSSKVHDCCDELGARPGASCCCGESDDGDGVSGGCGAGAPTDVNPLVRADNPPRALEKAGGRP